MLAHLDWSSSTLTFLWCSLLEMQSLLKTLYLSFHQMSMPTTFAMCGSAIATFGSVAWCCSHCHTPAVKLTFVIILKSTIDTWVTGAWLRRLQGQCLFLGLIKQHPMCSHCHHSALHPHWLWSHSVTHQVLKNDSAKSKKIISITQKVFKLVMQQMNTIWNNLQPMTKSEMILHLDTCCVIIMHSLTLHCPCSAHHHGPEHSFAESNLLNWSDNDGANST